MIAIALRNSPDLREAELRTVEAEADQRAAAALPNPSYAVTPGNPFQYSLSLPFDFGPQRFSRVRAARLGVGAAAGDAWDVRQQVIFAVRQGFLDLLLADSLRALAAEEEEIVRQLVAVDSVRARSGDIPELGLARSSLELARVEVAHARARASVHAARLALQAQMGLAFPDTGFTVAGELRFASAGGIPDSLEAVALANRGDLAAAERRVEQSRALQSLARSALLPVPTLSFVRQPGVPFPSGSSLALGLALTVPLFDWNGAGRARAAAELEAARIDAQRARAQVTSSVATAIEAFRTARDLAGRYASGLLAQARQALEGARYAYERGSGSRLDFLDALRAYGQTRSDYYIAIHDYWVTGYELSRAAGTDLSLPVPGRPPSPGSENPPP